MATEYGRRLLPTILHDEAFRNPARKYAVVTKSNSIADGFDSVSFAQVSRAVNFMANWLQKHFENSQAPEPETTLAYVGVADVRYSIVFYAGIQCRYKVFLPSPRNPATVNVSLLEQLLCTRLLYADEVNIVAQDLVQIRPEVHSQRLPSLSEMLEAPEVTYSYNLSFADISQEAVLVLHSSGSTGIPKPVICTHGTCATYDVRNYPVVPGRETVIPITLMDFPGHHVYNMFPPFHLAGVMYNMLLPLFGESINVFGPPLRPPSGALAAEMLRIHNPRGAYLPPIIIEQLSMEKDFVELISQLDLVIFAGGPLPNPIGDQVAALTRLGQFYGSTEVGMIHQLLPGTEDWSWMEFHPNEPFELQPSGDGFSYEMVLFADDAVKSTSSFQHNYPGLQEWRTKDLFVQHPTKPGLWKFHARRDDILVLTNGHKVNPLPVETMLKTVPGVSGALVIGQGRPSVAILVELNPGKPIPSDVHQEQELRLAIQKANSLLPAYGQIPMSMIIFTTPDRPFKRAAKGTVIRRLTEEVYDSEIETLYARDVIGTAGIVQTLPTELELDNVKSFVRSAFRHILIDEEHLQEDENFFMFGLDSVKTVEMLKYLRTSLSQMKNKSELEWLSLGTIYRYSTIASLAVMLFKFLTKGEKPNQRNRVVEMQARITKAIRGLPQVVGKIDASQPHQTSFAVAITGTTGFLGGYLIKSLAKNKCISRIYCLNRSPQAEEVFRKRDPSLVSDKELIFKTINFTSPRLGLTDTEYGRLLQDCEVIIHNAWRVNFNLHLPGFEDNLTGLNNLINLSAASPQRPRLVFVSSVSATGWRDPIVSGTGTVPSSLLPKRSLIPENIVRDVSTAMDMGYAESKRVAEHVLYTAASSSATSTSDQSGPLQKVSNIPCTIVRLCQVAPEKNTKWPENDAIAALLRSCKTLGVVPVDFTDNIDWIPVNQVADIINDVVGDELARRHPQKRNEFDNDNDNCRFYNIVNPHVQPWALYAETLREWCGNNHRENGMVAAQLVPLSDWVLTLEKMKSKSEDSGIESDQPDMSDVPALRVLRLWKLALSMGRTHTYELGGLMKISPTMRDVVKGVDLDVFKSWLQAL